VLAIVCIDKKPNNNSYKKLSQEKTELLPAGDLKNSFGSPHWAATINASWRKHLGSTLIDLERLSGQSLAATKKNINCHS